MVTKENRPVIVIEDDEDDRLILDEAFKNLGYSNRIIFFPDGQSALDFLNFTDVTPFIILSDINLPKLNGFELRDKIRMDAALQIKCIPYLFFSTASSQRTVIDAYSLSVQGFFIKQNTQQEVEKTIKVIMDYWNTCTSPNNF